MRRIVGSTAAAAGVVAFAAHFAATFAAGDQSLTIADVESAYTNIGVAVQCLLLAAVGLAVALRPEVGVRVVALGALAVPWSTAAIDRLDADVVPGVARVFAVALIVGLAATAVAVGLGVREVPWSSGGVLVGDGLVLIATPGALFALLGVNWYRLEDLVQGVTTPSRFGSVVGTDDWGGRAALLAAFVGAVGVVLATIAGGWSRRVAGGVLVALFGLELVRRTLLSGDRLVRPGDRVVRGIDGQVVPLQLSGEPVLALLVIPLVGVAAGVWFLVTRGEEAAETS